MDKEKMKSLALNHGQKFLNATTEGGGLAGVGALLNRFTPMDITAGRAGIIGVSISLAVDYGKNLPQRMLINSILNGVGQGLATGDVTSGVAGAVGGGLGMLALEGFQELKKFREKSICKDKENNI